MTDKKINISIKPFLPINLLTVLFVYLKLTEQIDWSWFWVTAPSWLPFCLAWGMIVCFWGFFMLVAMLSAMFK